MEVPLRSTYKKIRPFAIYLKPYRAWLWVALVCLVLGGLLAPFSIAMLLPTIQVIMISQAQTSKEQAGQAKASHSPIGMDAAFSPTPAPTPAPTPSSPSAAAASSAAPSKPASSASASSGDSDGAAPPAATGKESLKSNAFKKSRIARAAEDWIQQRLIPLRDRFHALARANPFKALMLIAIVLIVITVLKGAFEYVANYCLTHAIGRSTVDLQVDVLRRVLGQDYMFFKSKTTGYLISRIGSDINTIQGMAISIIRDGMQHPFTLFGLIILLFSLSCAMSVFTMFVLPIAAIILIVFGRRLRKITQKSKKQTDQQSSILNDALRNYHLIKLFGTEEREIRRYAEKALNIFHLSMKGRIIRFGTSPLMEALGAIGIGGILLFGGYMVMVRHSLPIEYFVTYVLALTQFYQPIKSLSKLHIQIQEALVSAERVMEMLALRPQVTPPAADVKPPEFREAIRLDNVSFAYGEETVLSGIRLEIPKGKIVALVGPSGAGKSTLVGLLPRLYDPTQGRILLDGVDLREIDLAELRRLFGVVTQETLLFNDTVLHNIAYGAPAADRKKAEECARAANAHDFILELEQGYDTVIGQAGGRLSGGQAQRIAIARALYRDPPILLFDEATSHLDSQSEALVQAAIDRLLEGRTALVVAHRLSTVRRADLIVVMQDGKIIESGTHDDLMSRVEFYRTLYALQNGAVAPAPAPAPAPVK